MRRTLAICGRELAAFFAAPMTLALLVGFAMAADALALFAGRASAHGRADLEAFFEYQPWLYLALAPALSSRLWAAETGDGALELLLTLPIRCGEAAVGKFLAAWCTAAVALTLTFPLWLTASLLERPDNDVILAAYAASWLTAGALLALGEAVSAASTGRAAAFVATAAAAFVLIALGTPSVLGPLRGWLPAQLVAALAAASVTRHFAPLTRGVVALPDLVYFLSLTIGFLAASTIIVDLRKADRHDH